MFGFDLARNAFCAAGALVFSLAAVGAAVAPARLVEIAPVVYAGGAPPAEGAGHV